MVTTLRGRWARGGPVSSSSGGPNRFGGEQPAAAARPRRRCRHRGAVLGGRASAGTVTWARSGPPSGWSPARGCPRRRPGRSLPCPPPLVRRGDVRPAGRADVQCPGRPMSGVQASGHPGVRTDKLRCLRRCRHVVRAAPDPGVARCGGPPPVGPTGRRAPWSAGGVVACRLRPDEKGDGAALAVAGSHEVDRSQGRRLGRRPGCGAALAPAGRHGRWSRPGCRPGAGSMGGMGGSRCSPAPAGRPGCSRRRGADHGLAQRW